MTTPRTAQVVPLPPPYGGQYDRLPIVSIESPYCQRLLNYNSENGILSLRHGDSHFCQVAASPAVVISLVTYGSNTKFLAVVTDNVNMTWFDVSSGTPSSLHTEFACVLLGTYPIHTAEFRGTIYFLSEYSTGAEIVYYTGSAWGTDPFTFSTTFGAHIGFPHRNRFYMGQGGSLKVAWGGIDATSGAATVQDFSSVFSWGDRHAGHDQPVPGRRGRRAGVVFAPPRAASTPSGLVPFGLRARSREDPAGSAVEEGSVTVGAFSEPHAELVPRTSRGSSSASHDLAVDNRGNSRLSAEIEATDADRQLKFDVNPPAVVVEPGMAASRRSRSAPRSGSGAASPRPGRSSCS